MQTEITVCFQNGIKIISIPRFHFGYFFENWKVVNRIFRLLIHDSPDNIFCFNHSPCPELLASLRSSHPLSRQLYIIHNLWWTSSLMGDDQLLANIAKNKSRSLKSKAYKWILSTVDKERQMCQTVDAVACLTKGTCRVLVSIYKVDQEKIFLIPNGLKEGRYIISNIDKNQLRKQYYIYSEEKVILFVGRLSESKGIYAVLDSFCILLKEFPNIRLVLVGSLLPDLVLPNYAHIATKVTYTGHLERKELNRWYQMADIGVIPSYTEQCSYVGIEMMMHGLPIVASDGFGLRDMFKDGVNAIVAPIGKRTKKAKGFSENLARALTMLLSSEALRDKIGRNAREIYTKHYSLYRMKEEYMRLLEIL